MRSWVAYIFLSGKWDLSLEEGGRNASDACGRKGTNDRELKKRGTKKRSLKYQGQGGGVVVVEKEMQVHVCGSKVRETTYM